MGVYIYVDSRISVRGTKEDIEKICRIKDGWGKPAFTERDGQVYMRSEMEGLDPVKDGIVKPIDELCGYAKENNDHQQGQLSLAETPVK